MHKTEATTDDQVHSNVDELYRLALGLENPRAFIRDTTSGDSGGSRVFDAARGWQGYVYRGLSRFASYGLPNGKSADFDSIPEKQTAIIVLTNDDSADAKAITEAITDRLLFAKAR
jgi:hypothetical protein